MSSITISRSSGGASLSIALSSVVLPVAVPPEIRIDLRARTAREESGDIAAIELALEAAIDGLLRAAASPTLANAPEAT